MKQEKQPPDKAKLVVVRETNVEESKHLLGQEGSYRQLVCTRQHTRTNVAERKLHLKDEQRLNFPLRELNCKNNLAKIKNEAIWVLFLGRVTEVTFRKRLCTSLPPNQSLF